MSATVTEFAIRWEPAPPYPDFSKPFVDRTEAETALSESAFDGQIVQRSVTYTAWEPVVTDTFCGECWACMSVTDAQKEADGVPWTERIVHGMVLCPDCGNKRCPRATDHRHACTGSNESGQPGSRYQ